VFSNLYTLYSKILFAAATDCNRFVVDVAYNIVGVVTCSDNSTRRLLTCIIGSFFQFISLSHDIVTLLQRQHHNTKKLKFNKMLSILVDNGAANKQ